MIKKKKLFKTADLILAADMHLMEHNPVCRTDDFKNITQWEKLKFLSGLQMKHGCPFIIAGDIFDHWKPSPELISNAISYLPYQSHAVYGNHDLPQHNLKNQFKCGLNVLFSSGIVKRIPGGDWETDLETSLTIKDKKICVAHIMTYQQKEPYPGCTAPKASKLLRKHKEFDLIVTGDNHLPFTEEYNGRMLVNPGSVFRLKADQIDHKPRVYLWYADTNTVELVYIPVKKNVINREHLEVVEKRDERLNAFIDSINADFVAEQSFEDNLKHVIDTNDISKEVKQIIYNALEYENKN